MAKSVAFQAATWLDPAMGWEARPYPTIPEELVSIFSASCTMSENVSRALP